MGEPIDVRSPESVSAVLGGVEFEPVRYADRHAEMAQRLGFDVSHIVRATQHVPLCLRGSAHQESRKRLAGLIGARSGAAREVVAAKLPELMTVLLTPGRRDVMDSFVYPLVDALMTAMIDIDVKFEADSMVSRIFSQSIGVSKRRRMNAELGALHDHIRAQKPDLTEDEIGDRVALCILGTDAMRGTLGYSLHRMFTDPNFTLETDLSYPPCTGVPYIDREAIKQVQIADEGYQEGDVFRAWLKGFESIEGKAAKQRFFGFGSHTCLGRKLALEIWQMMAAQLHENRIEVDVLAFTKRRDDVFDIPQTFEIEVRACPKS